jgi:tetratricopeptide (TPR) repeat protein
LNRLGVVYNCQKRYAESEEILRKALNIDTEKLGVNSPILAEPYLNLGSSLRGQRRLDEAVENFRRGIEIMTKAGQRDTPNMAPVLFQYSSLLREMKLWADAERVSTEALGIRVKEKVHGESYN